MNTQENAIRIFALLGILGGLALQISHTFDQSTGRSISTFGFALAVTAYARYAQRLKSENEALRQQLGTRQEP